MATKTAAETQVLKQIYTLFDWLTENKGEYSGKKLSLVKLTEAMDTALNNSETQQATLEIFFAVEVPILQRADGTLSREIRNKAAGITGRSYGNFIIYDKGKFVQWLESSGVLKAEARTKAPLRNDEEMDSLSTEDKIKFLNERSEKKAKTKAAVKLSETTHRIEIILVD